MVPKPLPRPRTAAACAYASGVMIEALWVFGVLTLLIGGGTLSVAMPPEWLMGAGLAAIATGLVVSIPGGAYYHVLLRRALLRVGTLPQRWWLHPTRLHASLPKHERRTFMPWFVVGAAGWCLIILGAAVFALGLMRYDVQ